MIAELTLPRLGETMETGRVAAWLKRPGEAFRRGETLVEIESDKTIVEMPALADGVLAEIVVEAGEDADVGAVLCRYEDGRDAVVPTAPERVLPEPVSEPGASEPIAAPPPASSGRAAPIATEIASVGLRATPRARAVAREEGIVLAGLRGSGRRGRIEAADVLASRQAPAASVMREVPLPGGHLACRDWAAGQTRGARIVLLHGLAGDVQSWAQLAAMLMRSGRHLTAPDLPGHGGTGIEAPDIETLVSAVAAFLDGLGSEPVELVGHSLGGAVAALVARRLESRVRRLTLIAPTGLDRPIDVDFVRGIVRARTPGGLGHLLRRLSVRPALLTSAQLEALAAELSGGRLLALADALVDDAGQQIDITGELRALAMPIRLVWGIQDRIIPWTQASQAGSRAAIHLIQDAGHVPHWDQPAAVAALFD